MNFATGGACTHDWDDVNLDPYCSSSSAINASLPVTYSYTFLEQVTDWQNLNIPQNVISAALFVVFIGGNDMNALLQLDGSLVEELADILTRDDVILANIEVGIDQLHSSGARNFLLLNLPSILVTPRGLAATTNTVFRDVAYEFIGGYLEKLNGQVDNNFGYSDSNFINANIYGCIGQLAVGQYGGYSGNGFNLTTSQCVTNREDPNSTHCADPSAALWWDDIHPTTTFHKLLASYIWSLLNGDTSGCMSTKCLTKSIIIEGCFSGGSGISPFWVVWIVWVVCLFIKK